MKDYLSIWVKWNTLLQSDASTVTNLLEKLHIEVKNGFDVVARIATEETINQTKDNFTKHKSAVEEAFARMVFAGYVLFLVQNTCDPDEKNLIASPKTSELGNIWMESFNTDKGISYIEKIDPLISLLLGAEKNTQLESLLGNIDGLRKKEYQIIHLLDLYLLWSLQQGYTIGMIENELNS